MWRLEDLDTPRVVPGMATAAQEDLAWLGLDWDEGPDAGGPYAPYLQSERSAYYEAALDRLAKACRLFPCRISRKDLLELSSAPHGAEGLPPYPAALRPMDVPPDWYPQLKSDPSPDAAIRFFVQDHPVAFRDFVYGLVEERTSEAVGDFVLKRRDGFYSYQLAVVVDDLLMGINEVVRGADLLDSTGRQIQLIEALGGTPPAYAHVPLVVNSRGEKLSKRDAGLDLRSLRRSGVRPEQIAGYLGYSLGLLERPHALTAAELVPIFNWTGVPRDSWKLGDDLAARLKEIR